MTTASITSSVCRLRPTPTLTDRALLRVSRAVEALVLARMRRRASTSTTAAHAADDARRTAQALGAVGLFPR